MYILHLQQICLFFPLPDPPLFPPSKRCQSFGPLSDQGGWGLPAGHGALHCGSRAPITPVTHCHLVPAPPVHRYLFPEKIDPIVYHPIFVILLFSFCIVIFFQCYFQTDPPTQLCHVITLYQLTNQLSVASRFTKCFTP